MEIWLTEEPRSGAEAEQPTLTEEDRRLLLRHGFLFNRERDVERGQIPAGVPLGGIGAGKVELTPEGFFTALTLNNNQDCPLYRLPGCYFAVGMGEGQRAVARLLQIESVGQALPPVEGLDADLTFPAARMVYHGESLPVQVSLYAFSPHVPGDEQLSGLPCAFFRFTLSNNTDEPTVVRLLMSWENLINVGGSMRLADLHGSPALPPVYHTRHPVSAWSHRRGSFQEPAPVAGGTGLRFAAPDDQGNPNSWGEHLIWTPQQARVLPDRDLEADEREFARWLQAGAREEFIPQGEGELRAGALLVERSLERLERAAVDFVLTWHMPVWQDRHRQDLGVGYARFFDSAAEVLEFAWPRREELMSRSRAVRDHLEDSDLPDWHVHQLVNSRFVANTNTVLTREGVFSVNEAPTGMGGGYGALDQRLVTGGLWTTFFPQLDASELDLFSRAQSPEGRPARDLGRTDLDLASDPLVWPDLAAGYVLQVHRHHLRTGEPGFLERHWPFVRDALQWALSLDETGEGLPLLRAGRGSGYERGGAEGITAYCASLHEAGLTVGADLAQRVGEADLAAEWSARADRAHAARLKYLWAEDEHGPYLRQACNPATGETDDSCFLGALAGEWALVAAGIPLRLSSEQIGLLLRGIAARNFGGRGMRDQSKRPEAGSRMQQALAYYSALAMFTGYTGLAWDSAEYQDDIVVRPPSSHFHQTLTYTAEGKPQGPPYAMTAPACWLLLEALTGAVPDVPAGRLSLAPRPRPGHQSLRAPVFLPTSWFMLDCRQQTAEVEINLRPLRWTAPYPVERLVLRPCGDHRWEEVRVRGEQVEGVWEQGALEIPVSFDPGRERLEVWLR